MIKQSTFLKKVNFCVSRLIIATALLLTAALYYAVAKDYIKAPSFGISAANAAPPQLRSASLSIKTTQELKALFAQHDYCLTTASQKNEAVEVPSLYLAKLPKDFAKGLTIADKKELFMKSLLPLILEANKEIEAERVKLIALKELIENKGDLTAPQKAWLEALATKYRVKKFSLNKAEKMETLVARVDVIPVAMALGQAIEEAGWGMSKAILTGNATHGVTLPSGVKAYESLAVSVKSYMRNLNANPAYIKMREIRTNLREKNKALCGVKMMDGLYYYSERHHAYIRTVKHHITAHNLDRFEGAQLVEISV